MLQSPFFTCNYRTWFAQNSGKLYHGCNHTAIELLKFIALLCAHIASLMRLLM